MSSRLCVKNLPRKCNEQRLRDHFAAQGGEITDVRIMRKADGTSRMFGFVGFRTEKMATAARNYFNNTFMGTVKINVEIAHARGDERLARPWSKHSQGSTAHALAEQRRTGGAPDATADGAAARPSSRTAPQTDRARAEADPKLREYLDLMRPTGSKAKFWAADADVQVEEATRKERRPLKAVAKQVEVHNRKTGGDGMVLTKTHVTFDDDEDEDEDDDGGEEGGGGDAAAAAAAAGSDSDDEYQEVGRVSPRLTAVPTPPIAGMSDLDYLRSRQQPGKLSDDDDAGSSDREAEEEEAEAEEAAAEEAAEGEEEEGEEAAAGALDAPEDGGDPDDEARDAAVGRTDGGAERTAEGGGADGDEGLADTGRLFVRNLSYDVTDAELKGLFRKFGPIADVLVPVDPTTKRGKGFAYVQFMLPEHAVRALQELDATIFQGRLLHLLPAKEARARPARGAEGADPALASSFKKARDAERRAGAADAVGWNALFMGADAVAHATAEQLGLSKGELLGAGAQDAAVRLALGETALIQQTKTWFERHRLNPRALDALDAHAVGAASGEARARALARSKTTFLAKNLAPGTTEAGLHELFGRHGTITRLLLPPSRTVALVEFAAIPEARRAFLGCAYKKPKEGQPPLYLEWAPAALLQPAEPEGAEAGADDAAMEDGAAPAGPGAERAAEEAEVEPRRSGDTAELGAAAEEDEDDEGGAEGGARSVYVKNLNFSTDEAALRALFEASFREFPVKAVVIARKADKRGGAAGRDGGKAASMGFGFVEYGSHEHARAVVKRLTNLATKGRPLRLHEHVLECKLSARASGVRRAAQPAAVGARAPSRAKPSRKLTVRNLPFEASKREVGELFGAFGELQSVRVPKKMGSSGHRGFAFVEFINKQDALKAMEALANTHLYGRRLALEWAEDEQSLEALREKAKRQIDASEHAAAAKRRRADEDVGARDELGGDVDVY